MRMVLGITAAFAAAWWALCASGSSVAAREIIVAQDGSGDFNGDNEKPIIQALAAARAGDTVRIRRGTYIIRRTIVLSGRRDLRIVGDDGAVLKLPKLPHTTTRARAEKGDKTLEVVDASGFLPGTRLRIEAPGRTTKKPDGTPVPLPTFNVYIASVDGNRVTLTFPLRYPVPRGARIALAENVFSIRSGSGIAIRNLAMDGNMQPDDVPFVGHDALCGIWATAPYSYETGPTGEQFSQLAIENCVFRNFRGRCIALYSVVKSSVRNCICENALDAGIDIDHFCYDLEITDNRISRCITGIEINDGSRCLIARNVIEDCGRGVYIWRWCLLDGLNEENRIEANTILRSGSYGIWLCPDARRNSIVGNTIEGYKTVGIFIGGDDNIVEKNKIVGSEDTRIVIKGKGNIVR